MIRIANNNSWSLLSYCSLALGASTSRSGSLESQLVTSHVVEAVNGVQPLTRPRCTANRSSGALQY